MMTMLTTDDTRNGIILRETVAAVQQGRRVLLLTDRTNHIRFLSESLAVRGITSVGAYHGEMTLAERETFMVTKYDVCIGIMSMAKEAMDLPWLDTLVVAYPVKSKYEQALGRILRTYPNKKTPLVIDIVDTFSFFLGMARHRASVYRAEGYSVTTVTE